MVCVTSINSPNYVSAKGMGFGNNNEEKPSTNQTALVALPKQNKSKQYMVPLPEDTEEISRQIKENSNEEVQKQQAGTKLLYSEMKHNPIQTTLKIEADKLKNAFTVYPQKGFEGSKNANFYEFLTMGTVPYILGSISMAAVFRGACRFFDPKSAKEAAKMGNKAAMGVLLYGIAKTISKKFVEIPLDLKYGIDVNIPYRKKIDELPEERNKDNLVAYEYHKAYESVDFPYWDLFYNNKEIGEERNAYFDKIGRKMGFSDEELEHSDEKVKPLIKEKVVQTKAFSSLSSYLWGAVGVGIAMQKPFESIYLSSKEKAHNKIVGNKASTFIVGFSSKIVEGFKQFLGTDKAGIKDYFINFCNDLKIPVKKRPTTAHIAGRALFTTALGTTLLGNFITLSDFNKGRGSNSNKYNSVINDEKEKVIC